MDITIIDATGSIVVLYDAAAEHGDIVFNGGRATYNLKLSPLDPKEIVLETPLSVTGCKETDFTYGNQGKLTFRLTSNRLSMSGRLGDG